LPRFLTFFIAIRVGFHTIIKRTALPITGLGFAGPGPIFDHHRKYMFSVKFFVSPDGELSNRSALKPVELR